MHVLIERYHVKQLLLLLVVLIFFYFPVLFLGRTLQGPEMMRMNTHLKSPSAQDQILLQTATPQIFNTEEATAAVQRYPYDIYLGQKYRSLELPLWNSHQGIGHPFAAQYETSAFSPFRIVQTLFPTRARDWFFILNIWFAGIFAYSFFISTGVTRLSAFFGATAYMGSGCFSWFMQMQDYMNVSMLLPLVMHAVHLTTKSVTGKRIAFLGVATGLILLAGQPEAAFYCLFTSFAYFIFRACQMESEMRLKSIFSYLLGSALGILIASPLILLFLQLYQHSFTIHSHHIDQNKYLAGVSGRSYFFLIPAIAFPKVLDWPLMPTLLPDTGSWDFLGGYLGVVTLFFLIYGFFETDIKKRKSFLFFSLFGICFLLMNLGTWPFNEIGYLPIFRQGWSPRWGGSAWSFSLIVASTFAFDYLLMNPHKKETVTLLKKVIFIVLFFIYISYATVNVQDTHVSTSMIFSAYAYLKANVINISAYPYAIFCLCLLYYIIKKFSNDKKRWIACTYILITSLWYWLSKGCLLTPLLYQKISSYDNYLITKLISLLLAVLLTGSILFLLKKKKKTFIFSFIFIYILSIIQIMTAYPGYPKYLNIQKTEPFITFLQENAGTNRIFALNSILTPCYASIYGLYDIRFITALSISEYQNFSEHYIKKQPDYNYKNWFDANYSLHKQRLGFDFDRIEFSKNPTIDLLNKAIKPTDFIVEFRKSFGKAINLLGVKYIITSKDQNEEWMQKTYADISKQLKIVYQDSYVNIYENKSALPRVFLVDNIVLSDSYKNAQELAMDENFDITSMAVLEKKLSLPNNTQKFIYNTKIERYSDNRVTIQYNSNKPALLTLTDSYYPGWKAEIDGKAARIYRVNGLFKGVLVPDGTHLVDFYYSSTLFKAGLFFLVLGVFALLYLFLT